MTGGKSLLALVDLFANLSTIYSQIPETAVAEGLVLILKA
jgi:hypothetical protein